MGRNTSLQTQKRYCRAAEIIPVWGPVPGCSPAFAQWILPATLNEKSRINNGGTSEQKFTTNLVKIHKLAPWIRQKNVVPTDKGKTVWSETSTTVWNGEQMTAYSHAELIFSYFFWMSHGERMTRPALGKTKVSFCTIGRGHDIILSIQSRRHPACSFCCLIIKKRKEDISLCVNNGGYSCPYF